MSLWQVDDLVRIQCQRQNSGRRLNHGNRNAGGGFYCPNQKDVLINLNDRLAAYLEKVRTLEEANRQLEEKIKNLSEKRAIDHDHSRYLKTIDELESQIRSAKQANAECWLNIENMKTAADGFKEKYKEELTLQNTIKDDVKKLKAASSGLEMEIRCLEVEEQILTKELENLKQDQNEEREGLLQEKSKCQVNVEVDSMQPTELTDALEKMREQYKAMASHHQQHYESLLEEKFKETTQENSKETELLQSQRRHLSLLLRKVQELETELEVQHSLKSARESELYEIKAGYAVYLESIQGTVLKLQDALANIRSAAEKLTSDSRILYYLKDLLEMEIRTYAILMDDEEKRIETVIHEPSYNRQMFLFLVSESRSSLTRSLLVADQGRKYTERAGTSAFHELEENVN
ncbi:keratin, type I cytoskeletal 12-like isoform X1 [Aquarana catesbeiana]|uniref:keratin, type I cytoskeletal 12-like isoform X1 n=1 Tax=Aquarana catesbeiana TaxID=8400 RepID=UPI003CCA1AEB